METLKDKIDKALIVIDFEIVDEHYDLFMDYALWILNGVEVDYTKYSLIRTPKYFRFLLNELKPHINFIL